MDEASNPFHYSELLTKIYVKALESVPNFLSSHPDTVDGLAAKLNAEMGTEYDIEIILPPIISALNSFPSDKIRMISPKNPKSTYPGKHDIPQIYANVRKYNCDVNYWTEVAELRELQSKS